MFDSIRIKARDEQTAVTVARDLPAQLRPRLVHEGEEWEVQVESESDDDLSDLLSILYDRLHSPDRSVNVLVNGEPYQPVQ